MTKMAGIDIKKQKGLNFANNTVSKQNNIHTCMNVYDNIVACQRGGVSNKPPGQ